MHFIGIKTEKSIFYAHEALSDKNIWDDMENGAYIFFTVLRRVKQDIKKQSMKKFIVFIQIKSA